MYEERPKALKAKLATPFVQHVTVKKEYSQECVFSFDNFRQAHTIKLKCVSTYLNYDLICLKELHKGISIILTVMCCKMYHFVHTCTLLKFKALYNVFIFIFFILSCFFPVTISEHPGHSSGWPQASSSMDRRMAR